MGNSDEKPEKPIEDEEQNKKQEDMKKKKSEPYPVINSGRGQKPGNKNSNNPSDLKNKKGKDKKNSPPLENIDNIQNHGKKIVDTLINNSKKQSIVFDDKEE